MSDVPWESEEKRNYICMQHIITDVVSEGLRKVFKNEWNTRFQARFGAWDDTSASGVQLFSLENTRSRPNKNVNQTKFQDGDTNQWDCSVLFDAILYSNSIGKSSLNPIIKTAVDNIRKMRNKIMHADETILSDADFLTMISDVENAFKALGLPIHDIAQIKIKRNRYKSFQVLPSKPIHQVVYRCEKINEMKQELQALRINSGGKLTYLYISGNPGSGKSELSRQLCEDLFKGVNWETEQTFAMTLDAKDEDTILQSYQDFSRRLNCSESKLVNVMNSCKSKHEKIKDLRSLIESRIKNWKRWWIIVDNVENLNIISPLLPQMGSEVWNNGQIILTIQNRTAVPSDSPFTKHISVSCGLKIQECRQLLFLLSGTDVNDRMLDEVAEKLDNQPLAIAAAAVYFKKVNEKNCCPNFSWEDYLEKLKCKREVTEEQLRQTSSAYQSTMSAAVSLAVENAAENSLILHHTFDLFSLISFELLPLDIIIKYIQQLDQHCDKEEIYLAVKDCSLYLLTETEDCQVRLHRVVHDVTKSLSNCKQTETKGCSQSGIANKRAKIASRVQNVATALYCFKVRDDQIKMIPHLKAFNSALTKLVSEQTSLHSNTLAFEKGEICEIYMFFGKTLHHFCAFKIAVEFHNMNLQISRGFGMQNYEHSILSELGILYQDMGDFGQAKDYHQQALTIKENQLSPDHVDVAFSYHNLGRVYHAKGELDQAKDYYERALAIREKQLSPDHVDVARSYNNLGTVYHDKGEIDQAKDYYERALAIREKQLSADHVDVAQSYNNLGAVYYDKGELDQAKDYYERALAIREKQLSPDHLDVACSYNNLGAVYYDKGELDRAKDHHERALAIREKQLSPDHVDVAQSYNNLGAVYYDKGELDQTKDYYERALAIREKQLSPDHLDVACSYNNLGAVYYDKGELDRAKDHHERALAIREKQLSPDHVDVAQSYNNLGAVYYDKGELDQAKDYCERALAIREKQLSPDHLDVARSYNNLGAVYRAKGELDRAKDYHDRALAIREKQLSPDHVDVARSYNNLGAVYHAKGELDRAKDYHERALAIREKQLSPDHVDVARSYNNLGAVYHAKGELDQAKDYHERALAIMVKQLRLIITLV